jgi:hypothetical protein
MLTKHAEQKMRERDVSWNDVKKCVEANVWRDEPNRMYHKDITAIVDGAVVITVWREKHLHYTDEKRDLANIRQQKRLHKVFGTKANAHAQSIAL